MSGFLRECLLPARPISESERSLFGGTAVPGCGSQKSRHARMACRGSSEPASGHSFHHVCGAANAPAPNDAKPVGRGPDMLGAASQKAGAGAHVLGRSALHRTICTCNSPRRPQHALNSRTAVPLQSPGHGALGTTTWMLSQTQSLYLVSKPARTSNWSVGARLQNACKSQLTSCGRPLLPELPQKALNLILSVEVWPQVCCNEKQTMLRATTRLYCVSL